MARTYLPHMVGLDCELYLFGDWVVSVWDDVVRSGGEGSLVVNWNPRVKAC